MEVVTDHVTGQIPDYSAHSYVFSVNGQSFTAVEEAAQRTNLTSKGMKTSLAITNPKIQTGTPLTDFWSDEMMPKRPFTSLAH